MLNKISILFYVILLFSGFNTGAVNIGGEKAYRLCYKDLVSIVVYREPDLDSEQRIDGVGSVSIPHIGAVKIQGKTVREAEEEICKQFIEKEILAKPQVTISIKEYYKNSVSILGQVKQPGTLYFELETYEMDLREVISRAGGFTSIAKSDTVKVIRKEKDGSEKVFTVDLEDNRSNEGIINTEFNVLDKDVIFVPERFF